VKPSREEALLLHTKYGSSEVVVRHCDTVSLVSRILAEELRAKGKDIDVPLVTSGALLHDIGRSRTQTVRHGLEGSQILMDEEVEQAVADVVRRHVGAGISAEEAKALGLPDLDYLPRTIEEAIVCFADKMVDLDRVRPFQEEVRRFEAKGHDVRRLLALRKRIDEELGEDSESLIFRKLKTTQ